MVNAWPTTAARLDDGPLLRASEPVEASCEERLDRRRDRCRDRLRSTPSSSSSSRASRRAARRRADCPRPRRRFGRAARRRAAPHRSGSRRPCGSGRRRARRARRGVALVRAPLRAVLVERRSCAATRRSDASGRRDELLEQVEQGLLGPVDVLDDEHERAASPASVSNSLRTAHETSLTGYCSSVRPTAAARRAATSAPATATSLSTATAGASSSAIPAASRSISRIGQYVMPRPYGRQRPRNTDARRSDASHELLDQAALADPGVCDERGETRRARVDRLVECGAGATRAPRRARRAGARAAGRSRDRGDTDQPVRGHALGLPLQLERLDLLDVDAVADEPVRRGRRAAPRSRPPPARAAPRRSRHRRSRAAALRPGRRRRPRRC